MVAEVSGMKVLPFEVLQQFVIRGEQSSQHQLQSILTRIAESQVSKLRKLSQHPRPDISGFDPDILAQALVKLETEEFLFKPSPVQVLALFSRISEVTNLRLTELYLDLDWDVSLVPLEVFARALSRLEKVRRQSLTTRWSGPTTYRRTLMISAVC